MNHGYPTEEELRNRIARQLEWRKGSDSVAIIWRGYLAALFEWGLLEFPVYDRLCEPLRPIAIEELHELFSGEPLTSDQKKEIADHLQIRSQTKG